MKLVWLLAGLAAVMLVASWLPATVSDSTADRVLGQGQLTTNQVGAGAGGVSGPLAVAVDRSQTPNHLYVIDTKNNRVLGYRDAASFTNGAAADLVIGQQNFCSTACNAGGKAGAGTLCGPSAAALDHSGNLYVADAGNNRVLEFSDPFAAYGVTGQNAGFLASRVFGQADFVAGKCNRGTTPASAGALCSPQGLAIDQEDRLFIADTGNNRVFIYQNPLKVTNASLVLGQADFSSSQCDQGAGSATASSLCRPKGVALDGSGNLYVADQGNNRVLEYDFPILHNTAPAHLVFGQANLNSRVSGGCAGGQASANGLCSPAGVTIDDNGNLFVADSGNSRVLEYEDPMAPGQGTPGTPGSAGDTTADLVIGHQGGFTASAADDGGVSAFSLSDPNGISLDDAGSLYVADTGNNRVTTYNSASAPLSSSTASAAITAAPSPCPSASAATAAARRAPAKTKAAAAAGLAASPTKISFGKVVFFTSDGPGSKTKLIKVTNKTSADIADTLTINDSSNTKCDDTGAFTSTDSGTVGKTECNGTVSAGKSCQIEVTFSPTGTGAECAVLNITDGNGNAAINVNIPLSGAGFTGNLGLSTKSLKFGRVKNGNSKTKLVKLTSAFPSPPISISISTTGTNSADYSTDVSSCTAAKGAPCPVHVTFAPSSASGPDNATLTLSDDAANGGGTQNIKLVGSAFGPPTSPAVTPTPTSTPSGCSSPTPDQCNGSCTNFQVDANNCGGCGSTFACPSGDSCENGTCVTNPCTGSQTDCNGTCVDTTSDPNNCGVCFQVCSSGSCSFGQCSSGPTPTATSSAVGQIIISPTNVSFFGVPVGATSNPKTINITNDQPNQLNVSSINLTGAGASFFAETDDCVSNSPLNPFAQCQIQVTFSPTQSGSAIATLSLSDDFTGGFPQNAQLIGFAPGPLASATPIAPRLSPSRLSFPSTPVGNTSGAMTVTAANLSSTAALSITSVTPSNAVFQTVNDNCSGNTLAPLTSCTVGVTFTPSVIGPASGSLVFSDNAPSNPLSPQAVQLSGFGLASTVTPTPAPGQAPSPPTISPKVLLFPPTVAGNTSSDLFVTVTAAPGLVPLVLGSPAATLTGPFAIDSSADTCSGATLTPGATCKIGVNFSPAVKGSASGTMTFSDNAPSSPTSPQVVQLVGSGQ